MPRASRAKPAATVDLEGEVPQAASGPDGPFKRLGLHDLEGITPILWAALATEEPLLLIGG